MWNLLFYAKADQIGLEESIVIDQVIRPLVAARGRLRGARVAMQCKRDEAGYFRRVNKNGSWPKVQFDTYWEGTRRFRLDDVRRVHDIVDCEEVDVPDMGSKEAIAEFLRWSLSGPLPRRSPTVLVIWSHASGFAAVPLMRIIPMDAGKLKSLKEMLEGVGPVRMLRAAGPGTEKQHLAAAASFGGGGDILSTAYHGLPNLAQGLRDGLGTRRLDILLFNSCMMSCVEAAYEIRNVARFMVGSEELTPTRQWSHPRWASKAASKPRLGAEALSRIMVNSYRAESRADTNVSAVRLDRVGPLTDRIREFVAATRALTQGDWSNLRRARARVEYYGKEQYLREMHIYTIDIVRFFEGVARLCPPLAASATRVVEACRASVVAYARGRDRKKRYGSFGLSIFFPETRADLDSMYFRDRYDAGGKDSPSFVAESNWREFLEEYWRKAAPP